MFKKVALKHFILLLTFLLLVEYSFAQKNKCQFGTTKAKTDFSKGILRTYIFGLTNSFTFGKILAEDYGIEAIYWGCIVDEERNCYTKFMEEKIKDKFGQDVFEIAINKSIQLDSLGKGDRESEFPGGEIELMKFIYCNLNLNIANYSEDKKGRLTLKFNINIDGTLTDIEIIKGFNIDYDNEALRIAKLMPKWKPKTENGNLVKQEWYLPIIFDNELKKEYCPQYK